MKIEFISDYGYGLFVGLCNPVNVQVLARTEDPSIVKITSTAEIWQSIGGIMKLCQRYKTVFVANVKLPVILVDS